MESSNTAVNVYGNHFAHNSVSEGSGDAIQQDVLTVY